VSACSVNLNFDVNFHVSDLSSWKFLADLVGNMWKFLDESLGVEVLQSKMYNTTFYPDEAHKDWSFPRNEFWQRFCLVAKNEQNMLTDKILFMTSPPMSPVLDVDGE
jgi:hypothetical protein